MARALTVGSPRLTSAQLAPLSVLLKVPPNTVAYKVAGDFGSMARAKTVDGRVTPAPVIWFSHSPSSCFLEFAPPGMRRNAISKAAAADCADREWAKEHWLHRH